MPRSKKSIELRLYELFNRHIFALVENGRPLIDRKTYAVVKDDAGNVVYEPMGTHDMRVIMTWLKYLREQGPIEQADEIEQAINRIRMKQMQTQLDGHDRPQVPGTIARIGDHA